MAIRRLSAPSTKQETIQQAALALFSRFGLHGVSLDQIAAQAGLSKSNLLYYFASKEELYVDILGSLLDLWLAPLRAITEEQDPATAIGDYIRLKMINSRDHPEASRLFCLEMIQGAPLLKPSLEGSLRALVDAKADVVRTWIAEGRMQAVDPHHLFFSLWALTQHYADFSVQVASITGHTLDDPQFFDQALANVRRMILRGIGIAA
ncbi:transcriptional regulator, TetR family [Pseudomonas cuatrocienegasensis]|uniref:Transcriptional regulator, TetR family n=1 Tax=Pseudomonas cuatrocienegasensis TaxID=543360 RepID=A0ABY1B6C9_9PSED|nr:MULTISPECIES: HTH-type transcriptional regulator RutR [Pseudomonas]OEC36804.1 TetR family transcriptional regulator [Pseudomonas sp. 21C1]SEQ07114.1 transcriptional regulator, TetR family [Pseudomonas cuatrocienegasensis]